MQLHWINFDSRPRETQNMPMSIVFPRKSSPIISFVVMVIQISVNNREKGKCKNWLGMNSDFICVYTILLVFFSSFIRFYFLLLRVCGDWTNFYFVLCVAHFHCSQHFVWLHFPVQFLCRILLCIVQPQQKTHRRKMKIFIYVIFHSNLK